MNLDAANADPALHDTPQGRLELQLMGGWIGVVADTGLAPPRVIHALESEGPCNTVWHALYGKDFWSNDDVRSLYDKKDQRRKEAWQRTKADASKDFKKEIRMWLCRPFARDTLFEGLRR